MQLEEISKKLEEAEELCHSLLGDDRLSIGRIEAATKAQIGILSLLILVKQKLLEDSLPE